MLRPLLALLLVHFFCPAVKAAEPVTIGQLYQVHSAVLGEDRGYRVYLPASYRWASNRRYPVMFLLDGEERFGHTATAVDLLASVGDIPEMIVVGIDSTQRTRDFTPTQWEAISGGGGADRFKQFLKTELMPAVDKDYRSSGYRILSGHSLGALFTLYCLSAEPALFQAYIALAPTVDWDRNLVQRLLQKRLETDRTLKAFAYLAHADDSGAALADFEAVANTLKSKAPPGLRWQSAAFADETHVSVPLLAQVDALRRLYLGYRFHPDNYAKGLAFAEEHFARVSRLVGAPLPITEDALSGVADELLRTEPREALKLFQRNLDANPSSADAHLGMASALARNGNWQDAAREADRAVALSAKYQLPLWAQAYYQKRAAKLKEGPPAKAPK
jgi:predicted alpha/beta superfamily hydrolase